VEEKPESPVLKEERLLEVERLLEDEEGSGAEKEEEAKKPSLETFEADPDEVLM
jgi:hypothetical protein